jgi:ABC-type phosphate transport system substrate-binding protein
MSAKLQSVLRVLLILAVTTLGTAPGNAGAAASPPTNSGKSLAIIVNQSNPIENLSSTELRGIFLGERSHWPNGRRITLVMMQPGEPERDAVLREVCRMSEKDFNNHFLHGLFTGEVFASPKTLATPVGVRKFVFNVPGAIGYLRTSDVDASVKVVRIDGLLPSDRDYKIQVQARSAK